MFNNLLMKMKTINHNFSLMLFILILLSLSYAHGSKINSLSFSSHTSPSSFIQTSSETSLSSTITTSKKTRWTQDGRMCAHAFVQDGETFFDCTKSKSPDGLMNNKEWCYVDSAQSGTKTWDNCNPIMDYDQVRKYNEKSQREMTQKVNKLNMSIQQNIRPAEKTLTELKKLKSGQEELFKRINDMYKSLETINKSADKLFKTKNSWDTQKELIKDLEFKIQKMKERKKENDEKENESNTHSDDISAKLSAHEAILGIKKTKTNNCKGMMNYEDEDDGDGLVGKYYDNEVWIGSYFEQKDSEIDFDWTGSSPMKGINRNNFSIKWEGYLYVPYSGKYNFIIKADDGVELSVNYEFLLRKKMNTALEEDFSTKDIGTTFPTDPMKYTSEAISLQGGTKVKIIVKYFHSIHSDTHDNGQIQMVLFWESSEFTSAVLPKKYLYSSNDFPALKVTGFIPNEAVLSKLYENDLAFKNSDQYIIQDIPSELYGSVMLKYNSLFQKDEISFHLNTPSMVYIAYIEHYPNPLPKEFENTGMIMSLLRLDKSTKSNVKKIVASSSATLVVYKKSYAMGGVDIKLSKIGLNKSGIPFILFFGFDSHANAPLVCLGKTIHVSKSSNPTFKKCSTSSEKASMNCEAGFSGLMRDEEGGMWSSNNEGVGAWIKIEFKGLYEIREFVYKNRKNPAERNKVLELTFSNGRVKQINLKNTDEQIKFKIEPVSTKSVKITIKEVYGTINNGGSFIFNGKECIKKGSKSNNSDKSAGIFPDLPEFDKLKSELKSNNGFTPLFMSDDNKLISLNCRESLSNSNKFNEKGIDIGTKIKIFCPESCITTDAPVYGGVESNYTKDSAICRAAFHSGKLSSKGGAVLMMIGQPKDNFIGESRNGIKTEGRVWSHRSVSFEQIEEEDRIILKSGTKVDVNVTGSIFKMGQIQKVTLINSKQTSVVIKIETDQLTFNYPDKKIKPCGTHFKNIDCKGSLKSFSSKAPITIRFITKDYPTTGEFLPDYGDIYGKSGKPFGFTRVMSNKVISRGPANKIELETYVEFPPSPLSRYCNKPNPETNCEPVLWSVWAGPGKFNIKLFIGDPLNDVYADFAINGKSVAKSLKVNKNNLTILDDVIESKGGFITISSECRENCDMALSKLNAIEIKPFEDVDKDSGSDAQDKKDSKLSCGEAYEKGRCDSGPNVLHCIFEDKTKSSAAFCSGLFSLVSIPKDYKCKDQIGKYKCVKVEYENEDDCKNFCPKTCNATKCLF